MSSLSSVISPNIEKKSVLTVCANLQNRVNINQYIRDAIITKTWKDKPLDACRNRINVFMPVVFRRLLTYSFRPSDGSYSVTTLLVHLYAPLKRLDDPEVRLTAFLRVRVVSVVGVQIRHSHHERYQHLQQTAFMTRIQVTAHV